MFLRLHSLLFLLLTLNPSENIKVVVRRMESRYRSARTLQATFLERYIEIMRVRFGDRLVINVDAGRDSLDAMVPSLVLQPIVENAIRHGMADRPDIGHVAIRAQREGSSLRLEVTDDGPGLSSTPGNGGGGGGIGLANTRERLVRLYRGAGGVEMLEDRGGGLTVRLTIPFRASPPVPT